MSKKGSALMQVLVIGLIIATFAILMLRYAVTRSSNLSRTERMLETEIVADSCLEQYMAYLTYAELRGTPTGAADFECKYYTGMTGNSLSTIPMGKTIGSNEANTGLVITTFTITAANVQNASDD